MKEEKQKSEEKREGQNGDGGLRKKKHVGEEVKVVVEGGVGVVWDMNNRGQKEGGVHFFAHLNSNQIRNLSQPTSPPPTNANTTNHRFVTERRFVRCSRFQFGDNSQK